jgi:hypothetical protein
MQQAAIEALDFDAEPLQRRLQFRIASDRKWLVATIPIDRRSPNLFELHREVVWVILD